MYNGLFFLFLPGQFTIMNAQSQKPDIEQFKNVLKMHSLKATPQRLAVHEAMLKLGHASADMVTEEIRSSGNVKVTVASVYNILTNMAMLGTTSSLRWSRNISTSADSAATASSTSTYSL